MSQTRVNSVETKRQIIRNPLSALIAMIAAKFGAKAKEVERFLRFAVVGVSGAIVDFSVLIILQATILPPAQTFASHLFIDRSTEHTLHLHEILSIQFPINVAIATSIAFVAAVLSNFIWTTLWVYPDSTSRSRRRQLAQFTLISVTGGTVRSIWVTTMSFRLGPLVLPTVLPIIEALNPTYEVTPTTEAKVGSIVAQLIGMAVIMLWNFFANRYWTYGDVD